MGFVAPCLGWVWVFTWLSGVLVGWYNIGFLRGFGFTGCFRGMVGLVIRVRVGVEWWFGLGGSWFWWFGIGVLLFGVGR